MYLCTKENILLFRFHTTLKISRDKTLLLMDLFIGSYKVVSVDKDSDGTAMLESSCIKKLSLI